MKKKLNIIAREEKELGVCSSIGLGMINIRRKKKIRLLLLIVIHAGRSRRCARVEAHRRVVAHRMEMVHRA
jgi:hypothetical protein